MKSGTQTWIWLAILVVLFVLVSFFAAGPKQKVYENYIADSPSPTGVKAIYTLLSKDMPAKKWALAPNLLPKGEDHQLLIMIEPIVVPNKDEMKAYSEFMRAGNTILLLANNPKDMFGIQTAAYGQKGGMVRVSDETGKKYRASVHSSFRIKPEGTDKVLLFDKKGAVAAKRQYGRGELITAVAPQWMSNGQILKEGHLPLVLHLINGAVPSSILFDEYVHGEQNTSFIHVYPQWFIMLLLQGIIVAILWLWLSGKRFGPVWVPREETVRFSDEGIRALTSWYLRGRRYHDSLLIQADYTKMRIQERWGIPYSREWKDMASSLERKWHAQKPEDIQAFLDGLVIILEKEKLTKQEYLLWSRKLESLQKEVNEG